MSELTDILIQAMDGNAALALVLIGLTLLNGLQTRHFDKRLGGVKERLGAVETRVQRTETFLINGPKRLPDGGRREDLEEPGADDGGEDE